MPEAPREVTDGDPVGDPVERLGRRGLAWRAVALALLTGTVVLSNQVGNDLHWPFAPMAQFAFRVGENDAIRSTFLQGRTADGRVVVVPLSSPTVGVGRAEVESQIPRMSEDPRLLGDLAVAYSRLHPQHPRLEQLWLREAVTELRSGRNAAEYTRDLVSWTADGARTDPPPPPPGPGAPRVAR